MLAEHFTYCSFM